jgi:hypothetical protein
MIPILKKKYIIPIASALLFLGASFKTTFEIAKQIEIFTTFKELNTNYVDETNQI